MNNEEAMAVLNAHRGWINAVINQMNRCIQEVAASRWSATVKSNEMGNIKATAAEAGVDISAWDGKPAPTEEVNSGE